MLRGDRPWYLPSIALGEFRHGVLGSTKRAKFEPWLETIEAVCTMHSPDAEMARHYGKMRRALDAARVAVPYHDIWIAALAEQHGLEVVPRDANSDRIPGIRRIGW